MSGVIESLKPPRPNTTARYATSSNCTSLIRRTRSTSGSVNVSAEPRCTRYRQSNTICPPPLLNARKITSDTSWTGAVVVYRVCSVDCSLIPMGGSSALLRVLRYGRSCGLFIPLGTLGIAGRLGGTWCGASSLMNGY